MYTTVPFCDVYHVSYQTTAIRYVVVVVVVVVTAIDLASSVDCTVGFELATNASSLSHGTLLKHSQPSFRTKYNRFELTSSIDSLSRSLG